MNLFDIGRKIKDFIPAAKDFIVGIPWPEIVSLLKTISLIVSLLLLAGIIYMIFGLNIVNKIRRTVEIFVSPRPLPKKKLIKKWSKIEERLKSEQEAELKLAIIEADKLFDDILKRCGYLGKDMGDRLRKVNASQISNINDIWSSHKIRNNIVHNIDCRLTDFEAEKAVRAYKKALEELEML